MYGTLATVPYCGCRKFTKLLRSQMKFKNLNLRELSDELQLLPEGVITRTEDDFSIFALAVSVIF